MITPAPGIRRAPRTESRTAAHTEPRTAPPNPAREAPAMGDRGRTGARRPALATARQAPQGPARIARLTAAFVTAIAAFLALPPGPAHAAAPCSAEHFEAVAPDLTVTRAEPVAATPEIPVAHCLVEARMNERIGQDGKPYALRFELRLPEDWSGRFLHQFNGGNDGAVKPALGAGTGTGGVPALARGFAVVSSDAGHDGQANPEAGLVGGNLFGFDFEARRDYGYGAVARLHPVALAMTAAHYGRAPAHVYGYGTSNGGRHAMVAASRMPGAFDGLLAGYPGFNLPKAAIQHAWDVQSVNAVGPDLARAFSPQDLRLVADAVAAACDRRDGLQDGVIFDPAGCQASFRPQDLACGAGRNSACLPGDKLAALIRMHDGPRDSAGRALYNSWFWDTGIASGNWRFWKLQSTVPPWKEKPIIAVMGAGSLAHVFTTPPTRVEGTPEALEAYLMGFDFDRDAAAIHATSASFPESAMQVMTPPDAENPTLQPFQEAGGKLLIFHGVSDPVFSFKDTADWVERLQANTPEAAEFARFYPIPGMPHGQGGNAPDDVDFLGALIAWVEDGIAPQAIPARFRDDNPEAAPENRGQERRLCPWPEIARFTGTDPARAESYSCD